MTLAQQRRLKELFPLLFRELDLVQRRKGTPLGERTIECGPGWYGLVARLARTLEAHIQQLPPATRRDVYCVQVKEKFGGLRFYMRTTTTAIESAIDRAEEHSFHICEDCGRPGRLREGRWLATLCDRHAKARQGPTDADAQRSRWSMMSLRGRARRPGIKD
jgi:hypothetical protein